ncbi:MAG: hypothetical protein HC840_02760 [Leptolyngbyaceae cyanobacterium RM2_2_4]|nr:hypothetical protein [Leptolyngbyaceae cyanobacterium RM2_2_4]
MKKGDRIMSYPHHQSPVSSIFSRLQPIRLLGKLAISVAIFGGSCWPIAPGWSEPLSSNVWMAQSVVDGLPPPPSVTFGDQIPVAPTQPQQYPQQYNDPAPAPADLERSSSTASERFLVYINGDSPLLLNQVRRVEADAFFQNYDGRQVIQAGVFNQSEGAEQRIAELAAQGIGAEVVQVPGVVLASSNTQAIASTGSTLPPPELLPAATFNPEVGSGQQPDFDGTEVAQANTPIPDDSYYVVIPGDADDLSNINAQVLRLGGNLRLNQVTESRRSPLGPHVLVGPFANRNAATRWNRYFRDFGMDARVYYRR